MEEKIFSKNYNFINEKIFQNEENNYVYNSYKNDELNLPNNNDNSPDHNSNYSSINSPQRNHNKNKNYINENLSLEGIKTLKIILKIFKNSHNFKIVRPLTTNLA